MADRPILLDRFVQAAGWSAADRRPLAGDASDRSYHRLTLGHASAILMDAPPGKGDDPADFLKIASYLSALGLSAPAPLAQDLMQGFLLLEDFGDDVFAKLVDQDPGQERALYTAATDVLVHLAHAPLPPDVPNLSAQDWAQAASLAASHPARPLPGHADPDHLVQTLTLALQRHAEGPRIFIHRDFHAENLILLPDRSGLRQVGLLDFQLGQLGQPGYDLVSLLQDARRDVSPTTEIGMITRYAAALGLDQANFRARYATLGAQRALRILGIFARLAQNGKPRYLPMMPRVWHSLQRNLSHPALTDLRAACAFLPPPPSLSPLDLP